eukprot:2766602-Heterocapsa_arctica.AAC.1
MLHRQGCRNTNMWICWWGAPTPRPAEKPTTRTASEECERLGSRYDGCRAGWPRAFASGGPS